MFVVGRCTQGSRRVSKSAGSKHWRQADFPPASFFCLEHKFVRLICRFRQNDNLLRPLADDLIYFQASQSIFGRWQRLADAKDITEKAVKNIVDPLFELGLWSVFVDASVRDIGVARGLNEMG